jgi:uncharacterized protein (TIGR02231 family)
MIALALVLVSDPVVRVVVFPDRAEVTRAQKVACGEAIDVAFSPVPPSADRESLRAQSSEGRVDALRVEEGSREHEFAPRAAALDVEIRRFEAAFAEAGDAHAQSESTTQKAQGYAEVAAQAVAHEMTTGGADTRRWRAALDLVSKALADGAEQRVAADARQRELGRKLDELRSRRNRMGEAAQRRELVATARLTCPTGKTATVELTYVVGGAAWQPAYEARARDSRVELATWATVSQTTGEDWKQAQVVLSTAIPRSDATPPEIAPLKLWAQQREPPRKVLTSRQEYQRHAEDGAAPTAARTGMAASDEGLSVRLHPPALADVSGDGTPARLLVGRHPLRASFHLRTAPRSSPFVFRVADLVADTPFPLLAGPVDVFRQGEFVARYDLERVPAGAAFHLTFGLEENLRADRVVLEEVVREKGLLGGTRRHRYAYRLDVANYVGRAEEIEVDEPIPVSELDDVKVQIDPHTSAGYTTHDGIVAWRVPLKSGERKSIELRYHVDAPSSYDDQ